MAECGDENNVKFFCCGGEGCNVFAHYFSMLPEFFKATIFCCKGTSIGNCLTCKGNIVADLKAVLMVQMWLLIFQGVVTFAFLGAAVNAVEAPPQAEQQTFDQTQALMAMIPLYAVMVCFVFSLNYYGVVHRNGLCCCIPCCWCIEGDLVMYLIGALSILGGCSNLGKAMMTETDGDMKIKAILFLSSLPSSLFAFYTGVLVIKIAGLSEEERKHDLAESGDEEAPGSEDMDYEN